jgi:hypothetical protein
MLLSFLGIFIFLFIFICVASRNQKNSIVRIYPSIAEIIQPVDKLPLEFTNEDWSNIRADSITLLGEDLNVTSQRITKKRKSLRPPPLKKVHFCQKHRNEDKWMGR